MTERDAVRELLHARGLPEDTVEGGLAGLVGQWELIVESIEDGYELTLDDYLNDMDLRDLIAAALPIAAAPVRREVEPSLADADGRFQIVTEGCPCLWGEEIAAEDELDSAQEWWYFRRPTQPGAQLREDLEQWGLL